MNNATQLLKGIMILIQVETECIRLIGEKFIGIIYYFAMELSYFQLHLTFKIDMSRYCHLLSLEFNNSITCFIIPIKVE